MLLYDASFMNVPHSSIVLVELLWSKGSILIADSSKLIISTISLDYTHAIIAKGSQVWHI